MLCKKSPNRVPTNIRLSPTVQFVCAIGWKGMKPAR
jgi:hypothetical protein